MMKVRRPIGFFATGIATVLAAPLNARAAVTTCTGAGSPCIGGYNTTNPNGWGIEAHSSNGYGLYAHDDYGGTGVYAFGTGGAGTGTGVYASGDTYGLFGDSWFGNGVYARSHRSNAILAGNVMTDHSAAVVSANAGADSGLAFWGTGAIIITGTAQKPGGGSWDVWSDQRVKKDVKDFTTGVAVLKQVHPVTYRYNGLAKTPTDNKQYVGVIAQELESILPAMVSSDKMKLQPADTQDTDVKFVNPSDFTYILINAVKEQQAIIDRQEARIAALESGQRASLGGTGMGIGIAGIAFAGAFLSRRKRADEPT